MKFSLPVRLLFWILLSEVPYLLFSIFSSFPQLHWLPFAFLGLCIFLFREKPLRKLGFSEAVEFSTGSICGLIFMAYFVWAIVAPFLEAEELANGVCLPQNVEARCYTFSRDNCQALWRHFEKECQDEIRRSLGEQRATLLIGPKVKRCTYKHLDQSFKGNRRTVTDPACAAHFNSMDSQSY